MKEESGGDRIRNIALFTEVCADYAVSAAECAANLSGLDEVIAAWPTLPAELREDIVALVRQEAIP